MVDEQENTSRQRVVPVTSASRRLARRVSSSRSGRSLLVGVGVAVLLTGIEVAILWFLHPSYLRLFLLALAFPVEWVGAALLAYFLLEPLAILLYMRDTRKAQRRYMQATMPSNSFESMFATPVVYYQHTIQEKQQAQTIAISELVAKQLPPLLLLGPTGAGKTLALHLCQHVALSPSRQAPRSAEKIPVYLPLERYNLFLRMRASQGDVPAAAGNAGEHELEDARATFWQFLAATDLPGLRHLRAFLPALSDRGRLLFLCDDLHLIDARFRSPVTKEFARLLLETENRFVFTCANEHERELREFVELEQAGHLERATLLPLAAAQVQQIITQYAADGRAQGYAAADGMEWMEGSRLRYVCANPFVCMVLLKVLAAGADPITRQLDTRGRLLQAHIAQVIQSVQQQRAWKSDAPTQVELLAFLGGVACAARMAHCWTMIQVDDAAEARTAGNRRKPESIKAYPAALQAWLAGRLSGDRVQPAGDLAGVALWLRFAQEAQLIAISQRGVLSFAHETLAAYFLAEYLRSLAGGEALAGALTPVLEQVLAQPARWSEAVALWAGLLDTPTSLAERFVVWGERYPGYARTALALSLVCLGVAWKPPQVGSKQSLALPASVSSVSQALTGVLRHAEQRDELAALFKLCAAAGAREISHSLVLLLDLPGSEDFFAALKAPFVLDVLFAALGEIVDFPEYEHEAQRLVQALARFGEAAVERAAELSRPEPGRSARLQAATLTILGGTRSAAAVAALMRHLGDADAPLVERAKQALIRLGPGLSVAPLLQALAAQTGAQRQLHQSAFTIVAWFLQEQDHRQWLTLAQQRHIVESLVALLAAAYSAEPELQRQAGELLVASGKKGDRLPATDDRSSDAEGALVGSLLARALAATDETLAEHAVQALQEIGASATPALIEQLSRQSDATAQIRVLTVLAAVRDLRALPSILRLVSGDTTPVQQQVERALLAYSPASIAGVLDLLLSSASEGVAARAAHILEAMGEAAVDLVARALTQGAPGRVRLLVQILERLRNPRALPALIALLRQAQAEPPLAITVLRALSQFSDRQVVAPLIAALEHSHTQIAEEAIAGLSSLRELALPQLVAALDTLQDTVVEQRIRRALSGMFPFPGEQLVAALRQSSEAQARQILAVLQMQGADGAQALVNHLLDEDERLRRWAWQALAEMPGSVVVHPLLEALDRPAAFELVAALLLGFPEAMHPLVNLLGEDERGEAVAAILPRYGDAVLPALVAGLDDSRAAGRKRAQDILLVLVQQEPSSITSIVRLFDTALPPRARETLLELLTGELAAASMPVLLDSLEDAHLVDDVADAFVRLARQGEWQRAVLDGLLASLRRAERRRGAELALIRIGAPAVQPVGALLIDYNEAVALSAQTILREIGVPALPFIWDAHRDIQHPARRDAAMSVFQDMPTEVIQDELVTLLASDSARDIIMALGLLLERIHFEMRDQTAPREMAPALLDFVQDHEEEPISLRIIALLLLVDGGAIADEIREVIYDRPDDSRKLLQALLLIGKAAEETLLEMLDAFEMPSRVREEAAGILAMAGPSAEIYEYALAVGEHGLAADGHALRDPERLAIALRALGGLLASGHWDSATLQDMCRESAAGSADPTLFYALLGRNYEMELFELQEEQRNEREAHTRDIGNLTGRIVAQQERMTLLTDELTRIRHEHGLRGKELDDTREEREAYRQGLAQAEAERDALQQSLDVAQLEEETLRQNYEKAVRERDTLRSTLTEAMRERNALQAENTKLLGYNELLQRHNEQLQRQINPQKGSR